MSGQGGDASPVNGAAKHVASPLCLVLVGGTMLVGPCADHPDGRRVVLSPVYEHRGAIVVGPPNAAGESPVSGGREVRPLGGLVSLPSLTVHPDAVIALSELLPEERRSVEREYDKCHDLCGNLRAQLAGIVAPKGPNRIVMPPGVRG